MKPTNAMILAQVLLALLVPATKAYSFGVGIYDITGPAGGVNMMGYAKMAQTTRGIHTRLYSRAFVIQENLETKPVLFINLDIGMASQLLKLQVVKRLQTMYGDLFDEKNVLISATHTHSGPGGYFQHTLYLITSFGFVKENFDILVKGIVESVKMAKSSMMQGRILIAQGELLNSSINRDPAQYLYNPVNERSDYSHNVDTTMTLLKFVNSTGQPVAMLNWFPVHATSMNNSNTLISSDNKGLASIMFELIQNGDQLLGQGPFVGAFAQANEGDVSPNTQGPRCIDTGELCDFRHNTCNGRATNCIAFGPGKNMFESTKIIAERQVKKAMELFNNATEELTGPIEFSHQFIDMSNVSLNYEGTLGHTCKPAMGYSFAAGTTDGPGDFDFIQGMNTSSVFWDFVRNLIKRPSKELIECHKPKPILLATGEINHSIPWQPSIVETQLLRVGNLIIVALPGEFTTMSGRRIRNAVDKILKTLSPTTQFHIALAGLSNVYTSYIATPEEYQFQGYEGASTIFGPLTLPAYVQQFEKLTTALIKKEELPPGPKPLDYLDKLVGFLPPVFFDRRPWDLEFGHVLHQPTAYYTYASDIVEARFISANPRNDMKQNATFLSVDWYNFEKKIWTTKFTDANWETKFQWIPRWNMMDIGRSDVIVQWQVTDWQGQCNPGYYRIRHFGTAKLFFSKKLQPFTGTTQTFQIACAK